MNILFVFPSEREASVANLRHPPLICGAGMLAGEAVASELSEARPDLVLLAGYCGGLDPSLSPGSLVVSRQAAAPGEEILDPDRLIVEEIRSRLRERGLPFVYSRLLTVPSPAASRDLKRDLWNEWGAGGVDMETYWVARACHDARVPWLTIRAVLDPAGQSLPAGLARWQQPGDEYGSLLDAVSHPLEWPGYARLAPHYRSARQALKAALPHVVRAARSVKTVETLELV